MSKAKLLQKIAQVQKSIEQVGKNGYNSFSKYSYSTEADILEAVLEKANEADLVCFVGTIEGKTEYGQLEKGQRWASVEVELIVADIETGESLTTKMPGYAEDQKDKAVYKAITGATKYAYWKFFGLTTSDDPENEKESENIKKEVEKSKTNQPSSNADYEAQLAPLKKKLNSYIAKYKQEHVKAITGLSTLFNPPLEDLKKAIQFLDEYAAAEIAERKAG